MNAAGWRAQGWLTVRDHPSLLSFSLQGRWKGKNYYVLYFGDDTEIDNPKTAAVPVLVRTPDTITPGDPCVKSKSISLSTFLSISLHSSTANSIFLPHSVLLPFHLLLLTPLPLHYPLIKNKWNYI